MINKHYFSTHCVSENDLNMKKPQHTVVKADDIHMSGERGVK